MLVEWSHRGKPTVLGAVSGAVAGLVAVTPASGFVGPISALLIGVGGGVVCCFGAVILKNKLGYDDSLDAFGVHGVGGTFGALATGIFASKEVNPAGADGLIYGNPSLLMVQAITVVVTWVFAFALTMILLKVLDGIMGVRVSKENELIGLDMSEHGERSYSP